MKKLTIALFVSVCCCSMVSAQLVNPAGAVSRIQRLPDTINRTLDNTVNELNEAVEKSRDTLEQTIDTTAATLEAMVALPPIAVKTGSGELAFNQVATEHGWYAIEHEWLLMLTAAELKTIDATAITVLETTYYAALDMSLVRFRVSVADDSYTALRQRLPDFLIKRLDRNHVYTPQAATVDSPPAAAVLHNQAMCDNKVRVGVIDTAVERQHNLLKAHAITQRRFISDDLQEPLAHGTAVAGLLVGSGPKLQPLLPAAEIYWASVFYRIGGSADSASLDSLIAALNWLAESEVGTINMSLAGPPNALLEIAVQRVLQRGINIVAAVGNQGPTSPILYPAGYEGVIGVTAVDEKRQAYRWANRGAQVDFAALGVSVLTTRAEGGVGHESGTSMATPVITAKVACSQLTGVDAGTLFESLVEQTEDLGEAGQDPIYGYGLLGYKAR